MTRICRMILRRMRATATRTFEATFFFFFSNGGLQELGCEGWGWRELVAYVVLGMKQDGCSMSQLTFHGGRGIIISRKAHV